ncbi:MAG TPA: type II secretion system F family protein [Stellaceae bacterium]|nr:type II secretion system F family protein [Stellaceae bacterium]
MPQFRYRALRPSGGEIAGELTADNERDAAQRLQAIGNFPIEITLPQAGASLARRFTLSRGAVSARDRILFTRQLATLLAAGVSLDRGLALIAAAPGAKHRARLAAELLAAINRGESLSAACRAHPSLPPHYGMLIAAGEAKGDIAGGLARLADVLERGRETNRALLGALIYPASVLVVACLSVSFLLAFVVPQFATLLESFRREPPATMQFLLALSGLFQHGALPLALAALVLALYVVYRRRDAEFRAAFDRRLLRLPGLGRMLAKSEAERLSFLLGNLVAAGVPVPEAAAATGAAMTNAAYRSGLAAAQRAIERGDRLSAALAAGGLLPELALELVRVGEETGDLATMLLKAGDIMRRDIEATTTELIGLVTPVSIVLLGLLIGGIAYALLGTVMEVYDFAT